MNSEVDNELRNHDRPFTSDVNDPEVLILFCEIQLEVSLDKYCAKV